MDTATVYKIVLLAISVMAFYLWSRTPPRFFARLEADGLASALFAITLVMVLLGTKEWGLFGVLAAPLCVCLGIGANLVFTDWGVRVFEWAKERRGLAADVYMKLDQEGNDIMAWPITMRAKKTLSEVYPFDDRPKRRGAIIIHRALLPEAIDTCKENMLAVSFGSNLIAEASQKGAFKT